MTTKTYQGKRQLNFFLFSYYEALLALSAFKKLLQEVNLSCHFFSAMTANGFASEEGQGMSLGSGSSGLVDDKSKQRVPPTVVKKERRRSREEWVVMMPSSPAAKLQEQRPQPARVREMWTLGEAAVRSSPPGTPPAHSGGRIAAFQRSMLEGSVLGQKLFPGSPENKSPRKQVSLPRLCAVTVSSNRCFGYGFIDSGSGILG
jgi:hypothetical protein